MHHATTERVARSCTVDHFARGDEVRVIELHSERLDDHSFQFVYNSDGPSICTVSQSVRAVSYSCFYNFLTRGVSYSLPIQTISHSNVTNILSKSKSFYKGKK